jgi:hypothetical protein
MPRHYLKWSDDGPVLELERRKGAQLFDRPRQIADDKGGVAVGFPQRLALLHVAHIPQPLGHHPASCGRNVDADPLTAKILRRNQRRPAAAECVEDEERRIRGIAVTFVLDAAFRHFLFHPPGDT